MRIDDEIKLLRSVIEGLLDELMDNNEAVNYSVLHMLKEDLAAMDDPEQTEPMKGWSEQERIAIDGVHGGSEE